MNWITKFWLVIVLSISSSFLVWAQETLILTDADSYLDIGNRLQYFEDKTNQLKIDSINATNFSDKFQTSTKTELNFGYQKSTYWFKIELKNEANFLRTWLLEIDYPILDYVDFYYQNDKGEWQVSQAGDMYPFSKRAINSRLLVFNLPFYEKTQTFYLKVKTDSPVLLPVFIKSSQLFFVNSIYSEIGYGIFIGILLLVIINNLFVWLAIREISYLYYILYTLIVMVLNLVLSGHIRQFVWLDAGGWYNNAILFFFVISLILSTFYAIEFLKLKSYSRRWTRVLQALIILNLLILFSIAFLPYSNLSRIIQLFSLISLIVNLTVSILIWQKGNESARFYAIGYALYFIFVLPPILKNYALISTSFLTTHGVELGKLCEVILLSVALADRTRLERAKAHREKEEAQLAVITLQKEANETLEKKVQERTFQLQEANEELVASEEELRQSTEQLFVLNNNLVEAQKVLQTAFDEIEKQNKDITASISYASRIQSAMLPTESEIAKWFKDYFIFFRPRDIVSGDFYWFHYKDDKIFISAIDCTGHGVPGAFMSMVADSLLNSIIIEKSIYEPAQILQELNANIRRALKQNTSDNRDGMDMALAVLDLKTKTLKYAGAHSPLIYIQKGELVHIKGDNLGIGGYSLVDNEERLYTSHTIAINTETTFYMYSDGFQDQFGGKDNRKFMQKQFKELLQAIYQEPMNKQPDFLQKSLNTWMGNEKQVDDILVIGFKVS
jgi:two-component system, sensor histidine kinase LadS